jgi:polar amino acid transport system substrate-binding protein
MEKLNSRSRKLLILAILCLLSMASVAQNPQKQLIITTEPSAPFKMASDDGKSVIGITADKVHEIMRRAQIPYHMQIMSWNRAFELARNQADTCVYETARTPEREASFKWIGPISKGEWGIYGSVDKVGKITRLADIKDASIGGYLGDALGEYLAQHGYHVINSYDDDITLKNLLLGRLDYWTSDTTQAPAMIAGNHAQAKVALLFTYGTFEYYLACNPKVSDEWVETIKAKLKEIKADGTEAKIEAKYVN